MDRREERRDVVGKNSTYPAIKSNLLVSCSTGRFKNEAGKEWRRNVFVNYCNYRGKRFLLRNVTLFPLVPIVRLSFVLQGDSMIIHPLTIESHRQIVQSSANRL